MFLGQTITCLKHFQDWICYKKQIYLALDFQVPFFQRADIFYFLYKNVTVLHLNFLFLQNRYINFDIESQKLYLNPEINLETLSKQLHLKSNYVSQLINTNTNFNFNDYINHFRVDDAKKMFNNPEYSNYTIVAIGLEAGFKDKNNTVRAK